jgi:hypothetical protein
VDNVIADRVFRDVVAALNRETQKAVDRSTVYEPMAILCGLLWAVLAYLDKAPADLPEAMILLRSACRLNVEFLASTPSMAEVTEEKQRAAAPSPIPETRKPN